MHTLVHLFYEKFSYCLVEIMSRFTRVELEMKWDLYFCLERSLVSVAFGRILFEIQFWYCKFLFPFINIILLMHVCKIWRLLIDYQTFSPWRIALVSLIRKMEIDLQAENSRSSYSLQWMQAGPRTVLWRLFVHEVNFSKKSWLSQFCRVQCVEVWI